MQALTQSWPLTVDRILDHAAASSPDIGAVDAAPGERVIWSAFAKRVRRLARALQRDGVRPGEPVAVVAAPSVRALEAWYAVMALGAVCHPLDPHLPAARIEALLGASGDRAAFLDPGLLAPLEQVLRRSRLKRVIALAAQGGALASALPNLGVHDALIADEGEGASLGGLDEGQAALLVHSVGAHAEAKSVVLSHRACVLQGLTAAGADGFDLAAGETVLSLTPLWRAAGFGVPFAAPLAGAGLVLADAAASPGLARALADREAATVVVGGPSELSALYDEYRGDGGRPTGLKRVFAAGGLCPPSLARRWLSSFGVRLKSAWGLAEVSGLGGVFDPGGAMQPPFGQELKVADLSGRPVAHDGAAVGRLLVRGPTAASGYAPGDGALGPDGFLDTGDLAAVDPDGRIRLMGRSDEMVLVAGARAPAARIEEAALDHPATAFAAVIDQPPGVAAPGPVLVVQRKPGSGAVKADYQRVIGERLGSSPGPQEVLFVDALPLDLAGRVDKRALAKRLAPVLSPANTLPEPEAMKPESPRPAEHVLAEASSPEPETPAPVLAESAAPLDAVYAPVSRSGDEAPAPIHATEPSGAREPGSTEAPPSSPSPAAARTESPPGTSKPGPLDGPLTLAPAGSVLFTPRPRAPPRAAPRPSHLFLTATTSIGLVGPVLVIVAVAGAHLGLVDWSYGLDELLVDWPLKMAIFGVLSGVLGVFTALVVGFKRVWRRATVSLLAPVAVLAGVLGVRSLADSYPPVHEAATDWSAPLDFSPALLRARGATANPIEPDPVVPPNAGAFMNRRVAEVNEETCPAAQPMVLAASPAQAYAAARAAVTAEGLQLFTDDPASGRLEAVVPDLLLGFPSDVVVRVKPDPKGARVDLRSSSRQGRSDLGSNCARITRLLAAIGAAVGS